MSANSLIGIKIFLIEISFSISIGNKKEWNDNDIFGAAILYRSHSKLTKLTLKQSNESEFNA